MTLPRGRRTDSPLSRAAGWTHPSIARIKWDQEVAVVGEEANPKRLELGSAAGRTKTKHNATTGSWPPAFSLDRVCFVVRPSVRLFALGQQLVGQWRVNRSPPRDKLENSINGMNDGYERAARAAAAAAIEHARYESLSLNLWAGARHLLLARLNSPVSRLARRRRRRRRDYVYSIIRDLDCLMRRVRNMRPRGRQSVGDLRGDGSAGAQMSDRPLPTELSQAAAIARLSRPSSAGFPRSGRQQIP